MRASSGSRSASSSIEPLRSAKRTVTCLRSPSRARLRGQDLLGQVLGCRTGGTRAGLVRRRRSAGLACSSGGLPHPPQNAIRGRVVGIRRRAVRPASAAFPAELVRGRNFRAARGAAHHRPISAAAGLGFAARSACPSSRNIVAAVARCVLRPSAGPVRTEEFAEPEVAVGDERAHAELVGERQRHAVGAFRLPGAARSTPRSLRGRAPSASLPRTHSRQLSASASRAWLAASSNRPAER